LPGSIVADFQANVQLSTGPESGATQTRIVLSDEQIGFALDGTKQTVNLSDVFDIVQGVSQIKEAESTATVTLAFRADSRREIISISTDVKTLVRFQQVLYKQLLNGTDVVATSQSRSGTNESEPRDCQLAVTDSQICLRPDEKIEPIIVRRDGVTKFKTPSNFAASDSHDPVVSIYSDTTHRVVKTTIRMPSFRTLNLLGRYLRADLLSVDEIGGESDRQQTIEILLVDDNAHDLEMAEVFLQEQSNRFSIIAASSAQEALDLLEKKANNTGLADCIVSDYQMPGMDGLEFLNEVRERYPKLPFILYTGQGTKKVVKQAILDDVTDYVEKDVGGDQYKILAERTTKAVR
jgi:CheY-like chemotaxis protein